MEKKKPNNSYENSIKALVIQDNDKPLAVLLKDSMASTEYFMAKTIRSRSPLDQEDRDRHWTSYPVLSPKPALGAVFARTRTEVCPSRKELP